MSEHTKNRCQAPCRHETCDGATSPARKMFYHTRLDKQGYIDPKMGFGAIRKDFRTLTAMLCWMQAEFGNWSDGWAIDCVGKTEPHALMLKHDLERLIGVTRPDVYMRMNRLLASFVEKDFARRMYRVYVELNMAWNSRRDKTFATGKRAIERRRLFPSIFATGCHNMWRR